MSIRTDYTAIALVVDRSGSMQNVVDDTKGSVKQFITTQKAMEGKASFSLIQFDHEYEVLNNFSDLKEVDEDAFAKQYNPRGSTALLDAIGRATIEMNGQIEKMERSERPARVVIAIVTDGYENASTDYTIEKIKNLVEEKKGLGWDFIFLGAGLDTINVAQSYGFDKNKTAYYHNSNVNEAMDVISSKVADARLGQTISFSENDCTRLASSK